MPVSEDGRDHFVEWCESGVERVILQQSAYPDTPSRGCFVVDFVPDAPPAPQVWHRAPMVGGPPVGPRPPKDHGHHAQKADLSGGGGTYSQYADDMITQGMMELMLYGPSFPGPHHRCPACDEDPPTDPASEAKAAKWWEIEFRWRARGEPPRCPRARGEER